MNHKVACMPLYAVAQRSIRKYACSQFGRHILVVCILSSAAVWGLWRPII